jgi:hypothetical protein
MNRETFHGHQPTNQVKNHFQSSPRHSKKANSLRNYSHLLSWKVSRSTSAILFLILCLLVFSLSTMLWRGITGAHANLQSSGVAISPHASSTSAITVDFASRQNHAHPIGNTIFGVNGFSKIKSNSQLLNYLSTTHMKLERISVDMPGMFPTSASVNPQQQNWAVFDRSMTTIQALGLQPILTLEFSPPWLQPQNNSCPGVDPSHVYPTYMQSGTNTGPSMWGTLAAQVVAHLDSKYPAVHPYYEVWNEPDGVTFLCVPANDPNPDQTRLTEYKAIYAAAARQMKQRAQLDHVSIQVGGPALAVARLHASTWLPALVNDPTIAPNIDFISYHNYFRIRHADTWSNSVALMQDPVAGVAALFENVSSIVQKGKQPNAQTTPIFIDEYNTTTSLTDCCRNNKTFAPLWNALFVTDLLNSVNNKSSPYGPARAFPTGLTYFSAIPESPTASQFCLFGMWNSNMNCAQNGGIQPYPQYYTYQLLGDSHFLDITNSGYITNVASVNSAGLVVSGFYTSLKDDVLIVNTSSTSYSRLTISLQNPGLLHPTASVFTLDQSNAKIGTSSITLSAGTGGYTAIINVPAYSTVALSLT